MIFKGYDKLLSETDEEEEKVEIAVSANEVSESLDIELGQKYDDIIRSYVKSY